MEIFNTSNELGSFLANSTVYLTGNLFLTLLIAILVIILICTILKLPTELSAIFVLPLLYVSLVYTQNMYTVLVVLMFYLGAFITKYIMRM